MIVYITYVPLSFHFSDLKDDMLCFEANPTLTVMEFIQKVNSFIKLKKDILVEKYKCVTSLNEELDAFLSCPHRGEYYTEFRNLSLAILANEELAYKFRVNRYSNDNLENYYGYQLPDANRFRIKIYVAKVS